MDHAVGKSRVWTFDNLAFWCLAVGLLFLPIFTLPIWGLSLEVAKRLLATALVLFVALFWSLGRLRQGRLTVPVSLISLAVFIILILNALSALVSGSVWASLVGLGYEPDTTLALLVSVLTFFWAGIYFRPRQRFLGMYVSLLFFALFFFLLELVALVILHTEWLAVAKPLTAQIFNNMYSSLIGKWHDFGIYAGFILVSSLVLLEFFSLKQLPILRWGLGVVFASALLIIVLINYSTIWVVVGLISLFVFIYRISYWGADLSHQDLPLWSRVKKIWRPSFLLIIISLLFFTLGRDDKFGQQIGNWRDRWGVPVIEVKPSWLGTGEIIKQTLGQSQKYLWLGAGPNRFVDQWVKYKPAEINQTKFWNLDFRVGVGWLPSGLVTGGVLGFLAWLFFLGTILYYGWRAIFSSERDRPTQVLLLLAWLGTVYLWIFSVIYAPNNGLLILTFLVTGLLVAILAESQVIKTIDLTVTKNSRLGFIFNFLFILLVLGSILAGYLATEKYLSVLVYQKGLQVLSVQADLPRARLLIGWADQLSGQDLYRRALSELDISLAGRHLEEDKTTPEESFKLFSAGAEQAIKSARAAITANPQNYLNWLALGRVYEALVPLGVTGAYDRGLVAFTEAQKLNPTNPSILLDYFARLEIGNKNIAKAKTYAEQSLAIKENYVQAVSLLSRIDTQEGNADIATRRLEQFLSIFPQYADAGFYFQLGQLKYQTGDYRSAILMLGQAVNLVPNFSNAKYFLGLSLVQVGEPALALKHFQEIKEFNPDNPDLDQIIKTLTTVPVGAN